MEGSPEGHERNQASLCRSKKDIGLKLLLSGARDLPSQRKRYSSPDPWPSWGFLYHDSVLLPQENRIWLEVIWITEGDYVWNTLPRVQELFQRFPHPGLQEDNT